MQAPILDEHLWLTALVGVWSFESTCNMGPDQPPMTSKGREIGRSLGGIWIVCESEGDMQGQTMNSLMTLGYDPTRGRYVGTWIGSPMTSMFVYEGVRAGGVLPLETVGPSFDDPSKTSRYQDVIEVIGPNERTLTSRLALSDGSWRQFMKATYKRV
jgi:hypothetical protein